MKWIWKSYFRKRYSCAYSYWCKLNSTHIKSAFFPIFQVPMISSEIFKSGNIFRQSSTSLTFRWCYLVFQNGLQWATASNVEDMLERGAGSKREAGQSPYVQSMLKMGRKGRSSLFDHVPQIAGKWKIDFTNTGYFKWDRHIASPNKPKYDQLFVGLPIVLHKYTFYSGKLMYMYNCWTIKVCTKDAKSKL